MRICSPYIGLALLGLGPLWAQAPNDKVLAGFTLGLALPQASSKMELAGGTLNGQGIDQKPGLELGGAVQFLHSSTWSSRWGASYTFASPTFPVNAGDGSLAPRSASRNQLDLFGQALYHFTPACYGLAGLDEVSRKLRVGGTDLDDFHKLGCSLGAGYVFRTRKARISPEILYLKAGEEGVFKARVAVLF